jgi:hypothetical protein
VPGQHRSHQGYPGKLPQARMLEDVKISSHQPMTALADEEVRSERCRGLTYTSSHQTLGRGCCFEDLRVPSGKALLVLEERHVND